MDYGTLYTEDSTAVFSEVFKAILPLFAVLMVISVAVTLVLFVLQALGVYNMSKSAGLKNPWLAFIPVVGAYALGRLAGMYRKKDGKPSAWLGPVLLIFEIVTFITAVVILWMSFSVLWDSILLLDANLVSGDEMPLDLMGDMFALIAGSMLLSAITMAYSVFYYVSLWRIFASFTNDNETLYLVLSIFIPFLAPIFLFMNRKNEPKFTAESRLPEYMRQQSQNQSF